MKNTRRIVVHLSGSGAGVSESYPARRSRPPLRPRTRARPVSIPVVEECIGSQGGKPGERNRDSLAESLREQRLRREGSLPSPMADR
jgi:hypothetical protein